MRDEGFGQGGKILPGWRYRTGYIYIYILYRDFQKRFGSWVELRFGIWDLEFKI